MAFFSLDNITLRHTILPRIERLVEIDSAPRRGYVEEPATGISKRARSEPLNPACLVHSHTYLHRNCPYAAS